MCLNFKSVCQHGEATLHQFRNRGPQCKLYLIFSGTKEEPNFLSPLSLSVKYNDQIYTDTMELAKMSQWYTSYVMQVSHLLPAIE